MAQVQSALVTSPVTEPTDWVSYEIELRIKERLAELEKAIEENDAERVVLNVQADWLRREQRALFGAQQAIWREGENAIPEAVPAQQAKEVR